MRIELVQQARDLLNEFLGDGGDGDFPIPEDQLRWSGGNLWKPVSDHGNLVILLRADWPQPTEVTVLRDDDEWEVLGYTGQSNPDRWTFRAGYPGVQYRGKKHGGGARVYYGESWRLIPLEGPAKRRWE